MNNPDLLTALIGLGFAILSGASVLSYLSERAEARYRRQLRRIRNDIDPTH